MFSFLDLISSLTWFNNLFVNSGSLSYPNLTWSLLIVIDELLNNETLYSLSKLISFKLNKSLNEQPVIKNKVKIINNTFFIQQLSPLD